MSRVYNFSAGPAVLPEEVLKEAAAEMLDYEGSGMSVMEMSHRSKPFQKILDEATQDLKDLMNIPDNYKVIFVQGGASQQFAAVPMNLQTKDGNAVYVDSGNFAHKAFEEAQIFYGENAIIGASSKDDNYTYIPDVSNLPINDKTDYVYICENNTIFGTTFHKLPDTKGKPLVSDQSSMFLSKPVDVTKYGVIYAGVQKNVGPAGLVILIIREDLVKSEFVNPTATMLKWKTQVSKDSLYNTPNCWSIYICGKVFKWLKKNGGLKAMEERNIAKAKILYDYLDESKLFKNTVREDSRSIMNVCFRTGDEELDKEFIEGAKAHNIAQIKGHRLVGGMRASIYNAMPIEGVKALVEYMKEFEKEHLK